MDDTAEQLKAEKELIEFLSHTVIVLGGRTFRPSANITFEQDLFFMQQVSKTGLDKVSTDITQVAEMSTEELTDDTQNIIMKAYTSGCLFLMLAGSLTEDEIPWTPEIATTNAVFFSKLTDPKDKKLLMSVMANIILGFLLSGTSVSGTSGLSLVVDHNAKEPVMPLDNEGSEETPIEIIPSGTA